MHKGTSSSRVGGRIGTRKGQAVGLQVGGRIGTISVRRRGGAVVGVAVVVEGEVEVAGKRVIVVVVDIRVIIFVGVKV